MKIPPRSQLDRLTFVVGLALACGALLPLAAQPQPTTPQNDEEDVIVLTPFDVKTNSDVGYVATSSLAGGRTDTPLKDTPAAISVITKEFMTDIAATGIRDVAEWTVNAAPNHNTSNTVTNQAYELVIRGQAAGFPSRNYFVWYVNSDHFATERLEFARGPNGVLFGDSTAAGLITTYSKRPILQKRRYVLNLLGDSEGRIRASVDLNEPIGDKGAIRVNVLEDQAKDWRDRVEYPRKGVQLSGAYRLTDRTTLRAEGEWGLYSRNVAPMTYWDNLSYWTNPALIYTGGTIPTASAANGVGRMTTNTWVPALPQLGVANWSTFSRTVGSQMSIYPEGRTDIPNSPTIARDFNLNAPDMINQYDYWTYTAYLDHRFSDNFFVQLAYNYLENTSKDFGSRESFYNLSLDLNTVLPGGGNNPKFLVPFAEVIPLTNVQGNKVDDLRLMATYRFERPWVTQRLSFITGSRNDQYDSENKTLYRVSGGTNPDHRDGTNAFRVRLYSDEPGAYRLGDIPTSIPGFGELGWRFSGGYREEKRNDYAQLASTTQFFDKRLSIHGGIRRDHMLRASTSPVRYVTAANKAQYPDLPLGSPVWGASVLRPDGVGTVATDGAFASTDVYVTSFNYGAVYFVKPWLGFYANHSETFQPPTSGPNFLDGTTPGFSRSEGEDYGVKVVLADGKLSATANYYSTLEKDRVVNQRGDVANIRQLWINSGRSDLSGLEYRDTQDLEAEGWEFEIVANPTRNLRLSMNYSLPETSGINLYPRLRAYYAENLPVWEAARAAHVLAGNTTAANAITSNLTAFASSLDGLAPGTTTDHTTKYLGNVYGTYTFYTGPLKNWAFGLGANVRGPSKIGNTRASAYEYYYSDSYALYSGHIAYQRKFGKITARFQLNVSNILDEDKIIFLSYKDYTLPSQPTVRAPHLFRYLDPRRYTFSTTLSF